MGESPIDKAVREANLTDEEWSRATEILGLVAGPSMECSACSGLRASEGFCDACTRVQVAAALGLAAGREKADGHAWWCRPLTCSCALLAEGTR